MIVLRGQKKTIEINPWHTIIIKLAKIQKRADFMRQFKTRDPMPVSQERIPRGGKKSPGPLMAMNSIAVSSERGTSWKILGYRTNVSNKMLPNSIIITHRYVRVNVNAIRCFFTVCSSRFGGVMAPSMHVAAWPP
jgi:hypothetical protein